MAGLGFRNVGFTGALPYIPALMYAPNGVNQVITFSNSSTMCFVDGKPGTIAFTGIIDVSGGRFDICRIGASLSERMVDVTMDPTGGTSNHRLACQLTDSNNHYMYYSSQDFTMGVLRTYIVRYDGTTNSNAINFMVSGVDVTPPVQTNGGFTAIRTGGATTLAAIGPIYDNGSRVKNILFLNTRITDAQCLEYNNNPGSTAFSFASSRTLDMKLNGNLLDASGSGNNGIATTPIYV